MANPPSNNSINLAAVQRVDACAQAIVDQATQVALYSFRSATHDWEKTDIEGCMFVYRRSAAPLYSLMIMNRQNPNDFVQPILDNVEFQTQKPYLFYRKQGTISGLWFYSEDECDRISNLLTNLSKQHTNGQRESDQERTPTKGGIMELLTKAQSEYGHPESVSESSTVCKPTPIRVAQRTSIPDGAARVEALFASASDNNLVEKSVSEPTPQPPLPDVLQRLFSVGPLFDSSAAEMEHQPLIRKGTMSAADLEKEILSKSPTSSASQVSPATRKLSNAEADQSLMNAVPTFESTPQRNKSDTFGNSSLFYGDMTPVDDSELMYNVNPPDLLITPQELTSGQTLDMGGSTASSLASGLTRNYSMLPNVGSTRESPTLSIGADTGFSTPGECMEPHAGTASSVVPLTKQQIQQAFEYLLKNDAGFLTQLHEAYVKSLNESIGRQPSRQF